MKDPFDLQYAPGIGARRKSALVCIATVGRWFAGLNYHLVALRKKRKRRILTSSSLAASGQSNW